MAKQKITSAQINTPIFRVELTGSLANDYNNDTMAINVVSYDTHGAVSGNTYVIPEDGYYFLGFNSKYDNTYVTTFTGRIEAYIYKDTNILASGFSVPGGANVFDPTIQVSTIWYCTAGQVITFQNRMQSTANTPATTSGHAFGYRIA